MGNCVERSHEDSAEATEDMPNLLMAHTSSMTRVKSLRPIAPVMGHTSSMTPMMGHTSSMASLWSIGPAMGHTSSMVSLKSFWSIAPECPDSQNWPCDRMSILTLVSSKAAERLPNGHMSEWQEQWCTPENVERYLDARDGDVSAASEILAEALHYREELKEVLSFARVPMWQTDFRVLARGDSGHTCLYFCMKSQVDRPSIQASIESIAVVCEMAVKQLRNGATTFDIVCDCHGLKLSKNLDPRLAIGFANLLKHPFRDRLRLGVVVDPGMAFSALWKIFERALPAKTKGKIVLASQDDAICKLNQVAGSSVANAVEKVMNGNRGSSMPGPIQQPTELDDDNLESMYELDDDNIESIYPESMYKC